MTSLLATCEPSGQCTQQLDTITYAMTQCYANGVTVQHTVNTAAFSTADTCKNGSTVSYSIETHTQFASGVPAGAAFTIKDGSGAPVATGAVSDSAGLVVTCSGGPTATLAATCDPPSPQGVYRPDGGWVTLTCSAGTCVL